MIDSSQPERFIKFGLLVTGKGEEQHLPKLFKELSATGWCAFRIVRRVSQLSVRQVNIEPLKELGVPKKIPKKHAEQIGLTSRRWLQDGLVDYIILVDDIESSRRSQIDLVYKNYIAIFDKELGNYRKNASVHFFVNMIEAYFFADSNSINSVFNKAIVDDSDDVEDIKNPKVKLKSIVGQYHEIDDLGRLLNSLSVGHVLSKPDTCGYLRVLFAWCIKVANLHMNKYCLQDGILGDATKQQLSQV